MVNMKTAKKNENKLIGLFFQPCMSVPAGTG